MVPCYIWTWNHVLGLPVQKYKFHKKIKRVENNRNREDKLLFGHLGFKKLTTGVFWGRFRADATEAEQKDCFATPTAKE